MSQTYMHLTNYAINKTSADYVNPHPEDILIANRGSKRTFASLWDSLRNDGRNINVEKLQ